MEIELPVSQQILTRVGRMDRFQGEWSSLCSGVTPSRLEAFAAAARVQSVASSCRLAGLRVSDQEVAGLLRGEPTQVKEAAELIGYDAAIRYPLKSTGSVIEADDLRRLNAIMLGADESAPAPSPFRSEPLHREEFDASGRATGRVFSTLPPRMVEQKTDELLTWLEFELRIRERHPVLVVAAFALFFNAASPFERGNGRMARLLATRLLRRAGYEYLPFASLECQIEELRDEHYAVIDQAQTRLWAGEARLEPWLDFFTRILGAHRERVENKIHLERDVRDYPPLQRTILETVREHGNVDAGLLLKATGANRNTLKDNLRRLVQRGALEKTGQRRGTRYRMAGIGEIKRES